MRRVRILIVAVAAVVAVGCSGAVVDVPAPADTAPAKPAAAPVHFEGSVSPLDAAMRAELSGRNWHPGCPVPLADMRLVTVSYWGFDGAVKQGPLVMNERVAEDVLWVFRRLFRARFRIERIALPAKYRPPRPSDRFSTSDVTAAFNCRPVTGTTDVLSQHSYGWAIDINPLQNPYVTSEGKALRIADRPYLDRSKELPGMIHPGDVVVRAFAHVGWSWGGDWHSIKDYMHFSATGK